MTRRTKFRLAIAGLVLALGLAGLYRTVILTRPVAVSDSAHIYLRYETAKPLADVLDDLGRKGIIRSSFATHLIALLQRRRGVVSVGSYLVRRSMGSQGILDALARPIRQILRLPQTNWANRTAHLLELHDVTSANEYMNLVHDPAQFSHDVGFPLPKGSLEGYLYPDHYDLPPLLGARRVILEQLREFEAKVWHARDRPADLQRAVTVASLVELEAGTDADRPLIAGVIENRLKKKMPLQIDATIEFALQKWRRLTVKDYRSVKSPYNTYLIAGLPPGPICSPDEKDIEAAVHPTKSDYLFYVALPNGKSIYASNYKDHLKNIRVMKAAWKALKS